MVAVQARPPEFVGTLRDGDTDTCRASSWASASASISRYDDGWARVPIRLPLPQLEKVERAHRRQLAATEKALERAAQAAEKAESKRRCFCGER